MVSMFEILLKEGKSVVDGLRNNIDSKGAKASGRTQKALRYVVEEKDNGLLLTVFGPKYVSVLEDGRGPTKKGNPGGKTLTETIREWIDDKGIIPENISKNGLAYVIARKIHKQGTNLYNRGGNSGTLSEIINEERVRVLAEELKKAGVEGIKDTIREVINVNGNK